MIHKDILIEELVAIIPESVSYLMKLGIKCIACGEPIWGTLADATKEKGFGEKELDQIVEELNQLEIKNKSQHQD